MSAEKRPGKALVIGAGLAGLSAAHRLSRQGWEVTVLEKEQQVGGRCRSLRDGGFTFDTGAQHIRDSYDSALKTAIEVGLGAELRIPEEEKGVFRGGGVHAFHSRSTNPAKLVPWGALGLRGGLGFAAASAPLARRYRSYNVRFPEWWRGGDGSTAAEFISRRGAGGRYAGFASAVSRYGLGAEPEEVSAAAYLAAVRFTLADRTGSFTGGMGSLARAIAARLDVRLSTAVEEVVVENGRATGVRARPSDGGRSRLHRAGLVVCAAPAAAAMEVAPGMCDVARGIAAGTLYAPGIVVNLGFDGAAGGAPGPVLIEPREGFRSSWMCSSGSKTAEYAPAGGSVVTVVFCGASARGMLASDEASALAGAVDEAARLYRVGGSAPSASRVHFHALAKPVAAPGHARRVRELRSAGSGIPGLVLAGDWTSSPTVEGAVRSGLLAADLAGNAPGG